MNNDNIQFWANIAQIASLILAFLAFSLQFVIWIRPQSPSFSPLLRRLRPFLPYILVAILSFGLGAWIVSHGLQSEGNSRNPQATTTALLPTPSTLAMLPTTVSSTTAPPITTFPAEPPASTSTDVLPTKIPVLPTLVPSTPILTSPVLPLDIKFHIVSLQGVGTPINENLGLPAGKNILKGVEFDTNWIITTQSKGGLDENKSSMYDIKVQDTIPNPTKVHFLLQASWAKRKYDQEIGILFIKFSDGQEIEEKLKVGYNIRDWADVDANLTSSNAQEAFRSADGTGVVDILTINIPEKYQQSLISEIEIHDTSEQMGIHIWAVTIE